MLGRKFSKKERLRSRKMINILFLQGKRVYYNGFVFIKLYYEKENIIDGNSFEVQFFVNVGKKKFSKAVHRNKIRRLIKEAYRNNKNYLNKYLIPDNKLLLLGVLYVGEKIPTYKECEEALTYFLRKVVVNKKNEE